MGIPLLILVFAGIGLTAFLAVNLIMQGAQEAEYANLALGVFLAFIWVLMLYKTTKARLSSPTQG